MFFTWNRFLATLKSSARKPLRRPRAIPQVEQLEDRLVLSTNSWTAVGPSVINTTEDGKPYASGRMTSLAVDPNDSSGNTVYAGAAGGGVWETQDFYNYTQQKDSQGNKLKGPIWTPLTDNLASLANDPLLNDNVGALTAVAGNGSNGAPIGDTVLYIGLGTAITTYSTIGTQAASTPFGTGLVEMVIDNPTLPPPTQTPAPPVVVSATVLGGSGASNIFYRNAISRIVAASTGALYVAVATSGGGLGSNEGVWKSTNGGVSWTNTTAQAGLPSNAQYTDLVIDPSNPKVLYTAIGEPLGNAANSLYMTTNGGLSWYSMTGSVADPLPTGITTGRTLLTLSSNIGSAAKPQYLLYAAFTTNAETAVGDITSATESSTQVPTTTGGVAYTVTLNYTGGNPLYQIKAGDLIQLTGVEPSDSLDYDGDQIVTSVGTNSLTYTVGQPPNGSGPSVPLTVSAGALVTTEPSTLYQLGYLTVSGNGSDLGAAFNVIGPTTTGNVIFNQPPFITPTTGGIYPSFANGNNVQQGDKDAPDFLGRQGFFNGALAVDPRVANVLLATESGTTVTIQTNTSGHATPFGNFQIGDSVLITGVGVSGYNGTYQVTALKKNGGTTTGFQYTDTNTGLAPAGGGTASGAGNLYAAGQDHFIKITGTTTQAPQPVAPTTGQVSGGSSSTKVTYYVEVTDLGPNGESFHSAITKQDVNAGNQLTVTSPNSPVTGAIDWNVYIGTSTGGLYLQNTSPIPLGTNWTQTGSLKTVVSAPGIGVLDGHVDKHALLIVPDPGAGAGNAQFSVAVACDGGVDDYIPSSGLSNLNGNPTNGLQVAQFYGIAYSPNNSTSHIIGGVQDNGLVMSTGGLTWSNDYFGTGDGGQTFATAGGYYYYINEDGGNKFSYGNLSTSNASIQGNLPGFRQVPGLFPNPVFLPSPNNPQTSAGNHTLWFGTNVLYMTNDAGLNGADWYQMTNPGVNGWFTPVTSTYNNATVDTTLLDSLGASAANPNMLYVGARGGMILVTTNMPTSFNDLEVNSIVISDGGKGYTSSATVSFSAPTTPGGVTAMGTVTTSGGVITAVTVTNPGSGYTSPPTLTFGGTHTKAASATAVMVPLTIPTWTTSSPVPIVSTRATAATTTTITVSSAAGFPAAGTLFIQTGPGKAVAINYTGITNGNTFIGCAEPSGFTFTPGDLVTFQNDLDYSGLAVDPSNANLAFVTAANFGDVTGGGHVWMTTNGGASWTNISGSGATGLPNAPAWSIQEQPAANGAPPVLYVGTDLGVYVSSNEGQTWSRLGPAPGQPGALPNVEARTLDLYQNTLIVGTFGRGAYEFDVAPPVWQATSLGGYVTQIASALDKNGNLELFGIGGDHALWINTQTSPGRVFSGWSSLDGYVKQITVSTQSNGLLAVFAIGGNNAAYLITQNAGGSWTPGAYTDLGGYVQQLAASLDLNGDLELFGIGGDNAVWYNVQTSGTSFGGWNTLNGYVKQITVGTNFDGTLQVFGIGGDNAAWYRKQQSTGNLTFDSWTSLGGYVTQLATGLDLNGHLELFGIGGDHAIWVNSQTDSTGVNFSGWSSLGGYVTQISVTTDQGGLDVFGIGGDNAIWYRRQNIFNGLAFDPYVRVAASIVQLSAVTDKDGNAALFAIGKAFSDGEYFNQV